MSRLAALLSEMEEKKKETKTKLEEVQESRRELRDAHDELRVASSELDRQDATLARAERELRAELGETVKEDEDSEITETTTAVTASDDKSPAPKAEDKDEPKKEEENVSLADKAAHVLGLVIAFITGVILWGFLFSMVPDDVGFWFAAGLFLLAGLVAFFAGCAVYILVRKAVAWLMDNS